MVPQVDPMNPEIKARWIEALTSGKYNQGHGALHEAGSTGKDVYCCLGVLSALAVEDGVVTREDDGHGTYRYIDAPAGESNTAFLVPSVMEWSGVTHWSGSFGDEDGPIGNLAEKNDDGASFTEIAELIGAHF